MREVRSFGFRQEIECPAGYGHVLCTEGWGEGKLVTVKVPAGIRTYHWTEVR